MRTTMRWPHNSGARLSLAAALVAASGVASVASSPHAFAATTACETVSGNLVTNCSFENPSEKGGFVYGASPTDWTTTSQDQGSSGGNGAGLADNGSGFFPATPFGNQVVFLQRDTGSVSQSVTFASAGTRTLAYSVALRTLNGGTTPPTPVGSAGETVTVFFDNVQVDSVSPMGAAYTERTVSIPNVAVGSHTLTFKGSYPNGGGAIDTTAFLDNVSLTDTPSSTGPGSGGAATPELGSGELLATGLLPIGAVLLYRRRRTRRATRQ